MALALSPLFGVLAVAGVVVGAGLVLALSRSRHAVLLVLVALAAVTLLGAA